MNRAEVKKRSYLACLAAVIARGFSKELAHDVVEASAHAYAGNWTKEQKREWFDLMFIEYQCRTKKEQFALVEAFLICSKILVNYDNCLFSEPPIFN